MKAEEQTPRTTAAAGLGLAIGAAVLITAITGVAFWLSYHHLHDVAAGNGLGVDAARAWAWPAVLDLFYLAGELLILRASYLREVDPWAIALTAVGALGSITLNVAGVGAHARPLEYTVAAVPPVAALLAFGALMRQLHVWFARRPAAEPAPVTVTVERAEESTGPVVPPRPEQAPAVPPAPEPQAIEPPAEEQPPQPPAIEYSDRRCAVIRALYEDGYRPTTTEMRTAIEGAGLAVPGGSTLRGVLRAEVERHEPKLAKLPTRPSPLRRAG
ncbi:DUF2637 domain-containing protein [Streptomyces sp. 5-8]|uniref:DUF2637 domain-containing protein n=1 Tax=Streptomyces musisoli TaxID=2802280 RepID=A0ABS1P5C5_9ACTN|nr:DUF2637 domain-containing protein [Streptomyces musisoli]MBL1107370.1 DUF2637 domain-containing protein [Streptomyces musisoli]